MCISNFNVSLDCFPKGHSNLHSHYHPHQNWVFLLFDFCQPDSWKDAVLWMYFLNINEIKLLLLVICVFSSVDAFSYLLLVFPFSSIFLIALRSFRYIMDANPLFMKCVTNILCQSWFSFDFMGTSTIENLFLSNHSFPFIASMFLVWLEEVFLTMG